MILVIQRGKNLQKERKTFGSCIFLKEMDWYSFFMNIDKFVQLVIF